MTVTTLAPAPLAADTVLAGFEVATLVRCGARTPGMVEFDRAGPAHRLSRLMVALGLSGRQDSYVAGGYHRYTVHRVISSDLRARVIGEGWLAGYRRLCAVEACASPRQRRHRDDLAGAAWRAALLAAATRGGSGPLAVRVADADLALVLVRAGRVLGAPVSLRTRGGRHAVQVAAGPYSERVRLVSRVS